MATGLEIIGGKQLFDLILGEAFHGALAKFMAAQADIAREEIVKQLEKGKLWAITDDKGAAAIFVYLRAARDGAARINLRMMAEALINAAQEPTFAPDEFRRQADALASLSRDEVLLLAAFLRAHRHAAEQSGEALNSKKTADFAWAAILADPSQFPLGFDIIPVAAALGRTGWVVPGSGFGTLTYYTTSLFDGVARLVDFEARKLDLGAG
jgi:hypothetical protein